MFKRQDEGDAPLVCRQRQGVIAVHQQDDALLRLLYGYITAVLQHLVGGIIRLGQGLGEGSAPPIGDLFGVDVYDRADGYRGGFDIILMDIEMGLMNGMEAAAEIRKLDEEVTIIFITNMAQYAIQGYSVHALDYVLNVSAETVLLFFGEQKMSKNGG